MFWGSTAISQIYFRTEYRAFTLHPLPHRPTEAYVRQSRPCMRPIIRRAVRLPCGSSRRRAHALVIEDVSRREEMVMSMSDITREENASLCGFWRRGNFLAAGPPKVITSRIGLHYEDEGECGALPTHLIAPHHCYLTGAQ